MQKVVLYIGIAVAVLMTLFPPWTLVYMSAHHDTGQVSQSEKPGQYRFIAFPRRTPGQPPARYANLEVVRLGIQLAGIGIITGGLMLLSKGRRMPRIDRAKLKKLVLLVSASLAVLAVGITVIWIVVSIKKPIPLSPNAKLEVKLAAKEPAEGLIPVTFEDMRGETLYVSENADLTTSDCAGAYMSEDGIGRPAITVVLTKAGGERMWQMSRANINRHVVMFINDQPVSAPVIFSAIRKKFVICASGEKEVDRLFRALTQP